MNSVVPEKANTLNNNNSNEITLLNIEEVPDLGQYWRTIKRSKWLIMLITFFSLIVGGFIASSAVPMYKATSKILADPQTPGADRNEQYIATALVFLYYETQYEIIKSRNVAEVVVNKLNLVEKYKEEQKQLKTEKPSGFSATIKAFKTKITSIISSDESLQKNTVELTDNDLRIMLATTIQANIEVSGGKQSQIINISYVSDDPQEAADIINALSEAYIQFGLESRLGEVKNTEAWLSDQSSQLKQKLQDSEAKLSAYRSQEGLVNTGQQQLLANSQLQSLNSELIRAQTNLSAAEEQYLAVKNIEPGSRETYSLGPVLQNRTTSDLVKNESQLSQRVNELFERYGEKHPVMIAARSELNSARNSLQNEVNKVVENIEKNYKLAQFQVTNIQKLIAKSRNDIQSLQSENFSLVSLEREVENNRRIYENFQVSLMEANGKSEYSSSNVHIIDKATVPATPFKPNIKLIIVLAGIFGLFIGVVLTFVREALDNTFKTPDAVEEKLKLPSLGITPVVKINKKTATPEKQYLDDSLSPFAESINTIRTGLLFSNIDNPPKTILVTSATGSEGKSTMAMNLAAAYSNLGKTLLLEVDLRKPSVAKNLGITNKLGLTDLISGSVTSASEILYKDNDDKLNVITCGTIARNPLELLSSKKFEDVLASLQTHYEYIILDGPPTLPVSDSCILANKVDGVIFAVKAEDTRIKVAKEAVSRLQKLNANIIGTVLTVAEPHKMSYYGDHYYSGEYYGVKPEK
ncbi:polysaccharide biosynthesis tyrosine autokinase [Pseudocolwellia sp. AS88]|uniref:GumC family protein n=1 Tax=Pseudocolwellia sp. AS88 TaxID=3063958 RepID=UPI0026F02822|nr:polysaccharide biosynthesis tyrosine autokinase [Pseudocolwellia sp. AS88]MDO7086809.1 polysaccharide biosynthesis tyrosine autokinase [Pseudocolwellia sp. AS88]